MQESLEARDHFSNVLLKYVIFDDVKHKLYVLCVRGAGEVRVDISRAQVVDVYEHLGNELACTDVVTSGT